MLYVLGGPLRYSESEVEKLLSGMGLCAKQEIKQTQTASEQKQNGLQA
jgi:hypothetical protein